MTLAVFVVKWRGSEGVGRGMTGLGEVDRVFFIIYVFVVVFVSSGKRRVRG